jgi:hypothetical protein
MSMPTTDVVLYRDANDETREAYLAGLRNQRHLDGNANAWTCAKCGNTTAGDDILISFRALGLDVLTPLPFCPTTGCTGYGPDLTPAASE